MTLRNYSPISCLGLWTILAIILALCSRVNADDSSNIVTYSSDAGTVYLEDDRRPALYTGAFGDCQGNSLINVTRFDASLYTDNMTVLLHIEGNTQLLGEHVMLYMSVFAYGEDRFSLIFNPCTIDTPSLCTLNASIPIEANGMIPIGPSDVAGIPSIALSIPDFEGQAIIRMFSNTTQSQIACYTAVMTNGNSFSHPAAVGSILGIFTIIALASSVAVAVYGQFRPETRIHYAHSMSVFVVFSVFQHIFFTGMLSMNWPSVLVAFWSNYAWSAGMIYTHSMQASIDKFIGNNRGNISTVGSAPTNQNFADLGGGYSLSQIYRREVPEASEIARAIYSSGMEHMLERRALENATDGFKWYGSQVAPGLPLPGNYSGFAGTLAEVNIAASTAFLTGFLWFLILIVIIAGSAVLLKWIIEALVSYKVIKTNRLDFFRTHWLRFTGLAVLRLCFIAFFMISVLALFQFTIGGSTGAIAIAGLVLALLLVGMLGTAAYALWSRLRTEKFRNDSDKIRVVSKGRGMMSLGFTRESTATELNDQRRVVRTIPWRNWHFVDPAERLHVHQDDEYLLNFGWLSARFRKSKWWFFSCWLIYEFVRACFYGGAAGHPLTQVFGLLVWEFIALVAIVIAKPFESSRLNLLMVYLLGFSKVVTVALSSAFDPRFGLSRILTTVIGVVIIVIQGVLTICLLLGIVLGAISSYMSISRDREEIKPQVLMKYRPRYFAHITQRATDKPLPPPPAPEEPKEPYFSVTTVRREPKIEDEGMEDEKVDEIGGSRLSLDPETELSNYPYRSSVAQSVRSRTSTTNLPYGARAHRASWSTRDFQDSTMDLPSGMHSRMSIESVREASLRHHRSISLHAYQYPEMRSATASGEFHTRRSRTARSSSNPLIAQKRASSKAVDVEAEKASDVEADKVADVEADKAQKDESQQVI